MRRFIVTALLLLAATSAQAAGLKLYGSYRYMMPVADSSLGRVTYEVQRAGGWGAGADLSFSHWGSVELDYSRVDMELHRGGMAYAMAPDTDIFSAALNLHLIDNDSVDLFFGPMLSYVEMPELVRTNGSTTAAEDELTNGIRGGFDVAVSRRLWLVMSARYLDLEMRAGLASVEVDPLFVGIGAAWRFGGR